MLVHAPTDDIVAPSFLTYEVGAAPPVVYVHDLGHNKMLNPNGRMTNQILFYICSCANHPFVPQDCLLPKALPIP